MYKLHLIIKYLRKRRIAWWSLLAVTLCTTMVLVVISVMGGWLNMFEHSFQGLTGDIIVESRDDSLVGFPYYQDMIDRMLKEPGIKAAVPTVHTFGIINIGNQVTAGVQVMGLPLEEIGEVNRFPQSLYLQYNQYMDEAKETRDPVRKQKLIEEATKHSRHASFKLPLPADEYRSLAHWDGKGPDPATRP